MNIPILTFIIAGLATYRISLLFTAESGPAKIFAKLRKAPPKKSATADWLSCLWCFSMTASAVVCLALWLAGHREHWAAWFVIWTALSAVAIALNNLFTK